MAHFFCIFHALSFELNFFFNRSFPLNNGIAFDRTQTVISAFDLSHKTFTLSIAGCGSSLCFKQNINYLF